MLEEARRLLLLGWSVIPLKPGGKAPLLRWRKFMTARPSEVDLLQWWKRWPDANLGVVTGAVSGVSVLDVECSGLWALDSWLVPRTVTSISQGRGRHFFFRHHPDHRTGTWILEGVHVGDFRADGGIIALPPSRGPTGQYRWDIAPWERDLSNAPEWFGRSVPTPRKLAPLGPGLAKTGRWASRSEQDWRRAQKLLCSGMAKAEVVAVVAAGDAAFSRSRPLDYAMRTVANCDSWLREHSSLVTVRRVKVDEAGIRMELAPRGWLRVRRDAIERRNALSAALQLDPFEAPLAACGRSLRVVLNRHGAVKWILRAA